MMDMESLSLVKLLVKDGMNQIIEYSKKILVVMLLNLVDFDALYGHRIDPIGYGKQ